MVTPASGVAGPAVNHSALKEKIKTLLGKREASPNACRIVESFTLPEVQSLPQELKASFIQLNQGKPGVVTGPSKHIRIAPTAYDEGLVFMDDTYGKEPKYLRDESRSVDLFSEGPQPGTLKILEFGDNPRFFARDSKNNVYPVTSGRSFSFKFTTYKDEHSSVPSDSSGSCGVTYTKGPDGKYVKSFSRSVDYTRYPHIKEK